MNFSFLRFMLLLNFIISSTCIAFSEILTGSCGTNVTYKLDTQSGLLKIEGSGEMEVYSPMNFFMEVYAPWYWSADYIKKVEIADGVTSIGAGAFYCCEKLESISIPKSMATIGKIAFYECSRLTHITCDAHIPPSLGTDVFHSVDLSKVSLAVPFLSTEKYKSADVWKEFKLSTSTQVSWSCGIGVNCSLDIDSGELIVNGTGAISDYAKLDAAPWNEYREYIKRIYINDGITRIGQCAFVDLPNVEYVSLPSTLEEIGVMGLCGMGEMQELILPESLTVLENGALGVNQDLKNIILPSNLKTIGDAAFSYCKSLSEITIPENVTTIGINLFLNSGVNKVTLNSQIIAGRNYDYSQNLNKIFGNITSLIFGDHITSIGDEALYSNGSNNLTSVTFGKNVKSIGLAAFYGCDKLEIIDFKSDTSLETIGSLAFYDCKSLKEFRVFKSIKDIERFAFKNCYKLNKLSFDKGCQLTTIKEGVFANCSIKNLIVPEGVTRIESGAFNDVHPTDTLMFPHSLKYLSETWYNEDEKKEAQIHCDELIVLCDWYKLMEGWKERWPVYFYVKNASTWSDNINYFSYHAKNTHVIDSLDYVATPTSLEVRGVYCVGDRVGVKSISLLEDINLHHLPQGYSKKVPFRVTLEDGTVFDHYSTVNLRNLWLETCEPMVTSASKAILRAKTNIIEQENNIGFELRKYDAPSEMASKKIPGYLYNGMIEGNIDNISPTYYKVRAFYQPEYGEIVYGEWVTFDATDSSQSDPVVHTYDDAYVSNNNSVTLRGIVIEGTDVVLETGFEYWSLGIGKKVVKASRTNNTIFSTTISNLDSDREYEYRAYAVTDKGTTYGEIASFFIDAADAVEPITIDDISVGDVYNVSGVKTNHMTSGINIICMKNGVNKKVLIR